jgi:hypothetical protein
MQEKYKKSTKISHDYLTRRSDRVERNWSKTLSPDVRDELIAYSSSPHQARRRRVRTSTREEQERRLMQRLLAPPSAQVEKRMLKQERERVRVERKIVDYNSRDEQRLARRRQELTDRNSPHTMSFAFFGQFVPKSRDLLCKLVR